MNDVISLRLITEFKGKVEKEVEEEETDEEEEGEDEDESDDGEEDFEEEEGDDDDGRDCCCKENNDEDDDDDADFPFLILSKTSSSKRFFSISKSSFSAFKKFNFLSIILKFNTKTSIDSKAIRMLSS